MQQRMLQEQESSARQFLFKPMSIESTFTLDLALVAC
jgi:hypothetical protein